jgi:hypothetical protein
MRIRQSQSFYLYCSYPRAYQASNDAGACKLSIYALPRLTSPGARVSCINAVCLRSILAYLQSGRRASGDVYA